MRDLLGKIFSPVIVAAGGYRYIFAICVGALVGILFYGVVRFLFWIFDLIF